ncbi:uncharacterized protein LOC113225956 [Hyposmocoma kahamanoa]|uniref:uncharacterized protein LOC113225956 n=1 Tax=Hyposmocoma kahamanoa TaxID=1477025 RepID=UPI000E6D63E8|nr:uncharacterized protein LOC113225956 [Hyposmocoma kahamanoa]
MASLKERPDLDVRESIASAASAAYEGVCIHLDRLQLDDVRRALQRLKSKTSTGPDSIPPFVFKDCRDILHIYNLCLASAVFPERWKLTWVVPVPKGASSSTVEGYRPVAILSTPAKVLETAIQGLYSQISAQLTDSQHGFRPARSTTSYLLNYMADVVSFVDSGVQVDAAYFDFKKAFDLVDNDVLLQKLASVGFTSHPLRLFTSNMSNCQ